MPIVRRVLSATTVAVLVTLGASSFAGSTTPLPTPGTPTQVAALVAKSSKINILPSNLVPSLILAGSDFVPGYYPTVTNSGCSTTTACVFGAKASTKTVVLFGDSHAMMWLPALDPAAKHLNVRLVLMWMKGCPAASVSVWDSTLHAISVACNTFRSNSIARIRQLAPTLVLMADRTSNMHGVNNTNFSDATWKAAEITTITALQSAKTKVAVIGDIDSVLSQPIGCLSVHRSSVQSCSVLNPNPKSTQHFAAEKSATVARAAPYVNPMVWMCTTVCSMIDGNMVVYFDQYHVTATFSEYLAVVWQNAVKTLLTT